jgi:hypothetical protein
MDSDFIRRSVDSKDNEKLVDTGKTAQRDRHVMRSNLAWLSQQKVRQGVLLIGGTDVDHFRIRFAQSRYRDDLAPSFWSVAGILTDGELVLTVPLDAFPSTAMVAPTNGVQAIPIADYDDAERFPNIAVIEFARDLDPVVQAALRMAGSRAIADFPTMMVPWLSYIWATDSSSNPLRSGIGLPSAVLVETAHASEGVQISPGQATASSAPEAIWQGARWWTGYYTSAMETYKLAMRPIGSYLVRQWAAAARGVRDDIDGVTIRPGKPSRTRSPKRAVVRKSRRAAS